MSEFVAPAYERDEPYRIALARLLGLEAGPAFLSSLTLAKKS